MVTRSSSSDILAVVLRDVKLPKVCVSQVEEVFRSDEVDEGARRGAMTSLGKSSSPSSKLASTYATALPTLV